MKYVIIINEECHGFIGVAKDMKSAFQYLLLKNWITKKEVFFIDEVAYYLEELQEMYEKTTLLDTLLFLWDVDEDLFDGLFSFSKEEIFETNT